MTISPSPHFVIFPFMSQGHTIPLLYLSRILTDRSITVTIITTPANYSAIRVAIKNNSINIIDIPFPQNVVDVPPGIELTDNLPSMSSFIRFVEATEQLKPRFEELVSSLQPAVSCIISDGFLMWTQDSADKLKIPRLCFYGANIFSMTMCNVMAQFKPHANVGSNDEPFLVPGFGKMKLTVNDFEPPFSELDPKGPALDFLMKQQKAMSRSHGLVVNSFYELEANFNEYWDRNYGPKAWLVGPFCVAKPSAINYSDIPIKVMEKPTWIQWLDKKLETNDSVVYVSFGTQAEASKEQIHEVAIGLEKSNISFIWVMKPKQLQYIGSGFEDRVKARGKLVVEWVDQMEILKHESVCGFLSHCGWNSMLESMCAGVPVLAMPLMAEQHLNARIVVEEIGMGLRLWARGKVARGLVGQEEVAKVVLELMEGEGGRKARERVTEVRKGAYGAMKDGGSSSRTLDSLIDHVTG
uniref:UDP-glycosyltransferase 90A1-like n=1 Tax=Erigeron canadensis TaxID=72917 RepID=UPI001CB9A4B4|nr:UDP-glycosyltransferase 90A1-like [Erigeron canadensis]